MNMGMLSVCVCCHCGRVVVVGMLSLLVCHYS